MNITAARIMMIAITRTISISVKPLLVLIILCMPDLLKKVVFRYKNVGFPMISLKVPLVKKVHIIQVEYDSGYSTCILTDFAHSSRIITGISITPK